MLVQFVICPPMRPTDPQSDAADQRKVGWPQQPGARHGRAVRTDRRPSGRADHRNPACCQDRLTAYVPMIASWVQKLARSCRFCTQLAITPYSIPHAPLRRTSCAEIRAKIMPRSLRLYQLGLVEADCGLGEVNIHAG